MEKEISSGTMLGIVLIALAAVIGLGFGVFSIAKGVANEGVVNVQDNLGTVSESAFEDFNQKIVTGMQITSAYNQFEGKPIAILINTQAMNRGVATYTQHEGVFVHNLVDVAYVNYNALLAAEPTGAALTAILGGAAVASATGDSLGLNAPILTLKDGIVTTTQGFVLDTVTGKIITDTSTGGFGKAGNAEYINSSAKFDSNLIKDASGTTVGVMFTQLGK